ncbi:hypothetical protein M3231_19270 [Neobacillus mesonae]|nr:hypothetical protein [Neobacillus mesonae]
MTPKPNGKDEKQQVEEAWNKLASRLEQEEMSPKWSAWSLNRETEPAAIHSFQSEASNNQTMDENKGEKAIMTLDQNINNGMSDHQNKKPVKKQAKKQASKKWIGIATAAAVAGVMLATPIGDKALAAILNQFRMDEVTVVNEGDVLQFFTGVTEGSGSSQDFIDKHGSFTNEYGPGINTEKLSLEEVEKITGLTMYKDEAFKGNDYYVSGSQTITMKLNIDEVNTTMKRLGAKELMPESLDGKPITFNIPATLYQYYNVEDKYGVQLQASLSQQKIPTVEVDPSVPIEEAVKAVLDFPLLPDNLKSSIKSDSILSGKLPMPVFSNGTAEKVEVKGVAVVIEQPGYYGSNGNLVHTAVWTQDGILYKLEGDVFDTKDKLLTQVEEMIK